MTEETPTPEKEDSMLDRMRERLIPDAMPVDDRGRMRMVVDSLVLHLHPPKVIASTMNWTYSWGLGGLSALLMAVLGLTGVILQNNYTPAAPQAYLDILEINSNVWFGELVRNLLQITIGFLVEQEYSLAPLPQHIQGCQTIYFRSRMIGGIYRIAYHLAVLPLSIHAGFGVVALLPRTTAQSRIVHCFTLRVKSLLLFNQQFGYFPF